MGGSLSKNCARLYADEKGTVFLYQMCPKESSTGSVKISKVNVLERGILARTRSVRVGKNVKAGLTVSGRTSTHYSNNHNLLVFPKGLLEQVEVSAK